MTCQTWASGQLYNAHISSTRHTSPLLDTHLFYEANISLMRHTSVLWGQGRPSPPETMMHFPSPVSDFPLFSKNVQTPRKIFTILLFPGKFLDFHPPKFLMTFFLVIDYKFPPIFPRTGRPWRGVTRYWKPQIPRFVCGSTVSRPRVLQPDYIGCWRI